MDVSGYFTVTEGVTYSVASSDDAIATASNDGSMVTIMGAANVMTATSATITVTATDGSGGMATQTIMVTVNPANNAPTADAIADVKLAVGGSATVDLEDSFSDADEDDTLTYAIAETRNASGAITASIADGVVSISGNKIGSAEIDVTGTDLSDASAMATIKVMVENQDPMPGAAIEAVTVKQDEMATVDLDDHFSDADAADTLTYTAMSDDDTVATVSDPDADGMITVTGEGVGSATITVTASDGMGGTDAEQTFTVTVTQGALTAPTNVMATVGSGPPFGEPTDSVTVTWTDGAFTDAHWVGLYDVMNNTTYNPVRIPGDPSAMTTTFANVPAGTYLAAVISTPMQGDDSKPMLAYPMDDDGKPMLTVVAAQ